MRLYMPRVIVSLLLILAPLPLPHFYYVVLRWAVSLLSAYGTFFTFRRRRYLWTVLFLGLLLLFNPFAPVTLQRTAWIPIDFVAAAILLYSMPKLRRNHSWVVGQAPEPYASADPFDLYTYDIRIGILQGYHKDRMPSSSRAGAIVRCAASYVAITWVCIPFVGAPILYFLGIEGRHDIIIGIAYLAFLTLVVVLGLLFWVRRELS